MATHASVRPAGSQMIAHSAGASRHLTSWSRCAVAAVLLSAAPVMGVCVGDCNTNGVVDVSEIITGVNIALGNTPLSACPSFDSSGDSKVTVDEILHGVSNALNGCGAPVPGSAEAKISVLNRSGSAATLTLQGWVKIPHGPAGNYLASYTVPNVAIPALCTGSPPSCYSSTCTCRCDDPSGLPMCDVTVGNIDPGLGPGEWLHNITVPATGQTQYRRDLLVSDTAAPDPVSWTVFKTVLTVTKGTDDGTAGTLRNAIAGATPSLAPVLIRFDHSQFPGGKAVITLTQTSALAISAANTMIDGTNADGYPSPIAPFTQRTQQGYPTTISVNPTYEDVAFAGDFDLTAPNIALVGLSMNRVLGTDAEITGKDQNLVVPAGNSAGSRVSTCRLDGGAADRTDANGTDDGSAPAQGKDCVDADNTGATSSNAVVVENSELRFCYDRGVKSKRGYLTVKDSWVHNNLRGGLFAQTPRPGETLIVGTMNAVTSLLEQNGVSCPNGAAPEFSGNLADCGSQVSTRSDASEMSTQATTSSKLSRLETQGNVIRDGVAQGLYFQTYSTGAVANDYVCGMHRSQISNPKGILIKRTGGAMSDISVAGTAVVYNVEGAKMDETIGAKFGDGSAGSGNNALAQNGASSNAKKNLINAQSAAGVQARGNQWQNCYTGQADKNFCKTSSILTNDVKNTVDVGRTSPDSCDPVNGCQPQQADNVKLPVTISAVYPTKVSEAGAIVHITGTGFDAISGHTGQSSGNCGTLKATNKCSPLQGTCVQFLVDGVPVAGDVDVLAVTPTHLVVKSPIACSKPVKLKVTRNGPSGSVSFTTPDYVFCKNP